MSWPRLLICALLTSHLPVPARADEATFSGFQVYETDPARLGANENKPRLFAVKVTAKDDAMWVEGADYNYEWLTVVPYASVTGLTLNRSRLNPYDEGSQGGWLGRQIARAGDRKSWVVVDFADKRGSARRAILLAGFRMETDFVTLLEAKTGRKAIQEGEPPGSEAKEEASPAPIPQAPVATPQATAAPTPPSAGPVRLMDVMTVSEFRACGLAKLSEEELAQLDQWLTRYVAAR